MAIELEQEKLLAFQVYRALDSFTIDNLEKNYQKLADSQDLTEEERARARKAITDMNIFTEFHREASEYENASAVYTNLTNKYALDEKVKDSRRLIVELQAQLPIGLSEEQLAQHPVYQTIQALQNQIEKANAKDTDFYNLDEYLKSDAVQESQRAVSKYNKQMAVLESELEAGLKKKGKKRVDTTDFYKSIAEKGREFLKKNNDILEKSDRIWIENNTEAYEALAKDIEQRLDSETKHTVVQEHREKFEQETGQKAAPVVVEPNAYGSQTKTQVFTY